MDSTELRRLVARERALGLFVVGLVFVFYASVWILSAAHAARVFEARCTITVEEHRFGPSCVAKRVAPGGRWEDTYLSFEDCRVPAVPVAAGSGETFPCYAFVNDPHEVALSRPTNTVAGPLQLAFLALGVAMSLAALGVRVAAPRRAKADDGATRRAAPFRDAPAPTEDAKAPVAIALRTRAGFAGRLFACATASSGLAITGLASHRLWMMSGELPALIVPVLCAGNGALLLAIASVWGRSGLVVDAKRGVVTRWWGIGRPMVRRYYALAAVTGVRTVMVQRFLRESEERLELRLDGKTRVLRCADIHQAYRELETIFGR